MRVAFGINGNGLGHATRSCPLIEAAIARGHEVHVISSGRALAFLRREFPAARFHVIHDYSLEQHLFSSSETFSYRAVLMYAPRFLAQIYKEHLRFLRLNREVRFDVIISDSRFGIFYNKVPSYFLFHTIRAPFINNKPALSELLTALFTEPFKAILLPDTPKSELAGQFTHGFIYLKKYVHLGILSMVNRLLVEKDIDYLISVSGPEPQRTVFERKAMALAKRLPGKVVVTLGKSEKRNQRRVGDILVYSSTDRQEQESLLNRAKLVITRSGYSTILDLAEIGAKALFIPTKGQPEQEYLAQFHQDKGNYHTCSLSRLNEQHVRIAEGYPGIKVRQRTATSVKKFLRVTGL